MTSSIQNGAAMHVAAPTAQIISLSDLQPAPAGVHATPPLLPSDGYPLHHIKARLTACVGSVVMTVGELLAARKDQVLLLDSAVADPVDLLVEGRVIARGQLVAIDDHFGVRITELAQPPRA
jgi:flagellar motor switch protein FliN/FliY